MRKEITDGLINEEGVLWFNWQSDSYEVATVVYISLGAIWWFLSSIDTSAANRTSWEKIFQVVTCDASDCLWRLSLRWYGCLLCLITVYSYCLFFQLLVWFGFDHDPSFLVTEVRWSCEFQSERASLTILTVVNEPCQDLKWNQCSILKEIFSTWIQSYHSN